MLEAFEDREGGTFRTLKKHELEIEGIISDVYSLFSSFINEDSHEFDDTEPFGYDFRNPVSYTYDFPYPAADTKIAFLHRGNMIDVPVDLIKSIRLRREELYD